MEFIGKDTVRIDRRLSDLDVFVIDFVRILRRHTRYVIVSGYVSILLGRARSSEDVDIIIPPMLSDDFSRLVGDLREGGFWCLQAETRKDIYAYFRDRIAVRFARKKTVIPNMELKCAKNKADEAALAAPLTVKIDGCELYISNLELQVAFKEAVLKSPKDLEDARHIRNIAGARLDRKMVAKFRRMLNGIHG